MPRNNHPVLNNPNYRHRYDIYSRRINPFSKRTFVPRASPEEESEDLLAYINDMKEQAKGHFPKGTAYLEDDWYDDALTGHGQLILSDTEHGGSFNNKPVFRNDVIKRWDQVLDLQGHIDDWNNQRKSHKVDFNSWLREIEKLIKGDKERLGKLDLAQYKRNLPAQSTLTQRARQLEDTRRGKGDTRYSKAINNLLSRPSSHSKFTEEQGQNILEMLRNEGVKANDDIARNLLEFEFKDRYVGTDKNRLGLLKEINRKALDPELEENKAQINKLNRRLPVVQEAEDLKLRDVYLPLSKNKMDLEKGLIKELENYGNQQHLHDEEAERRNEKVYNAEVYRPYSKLNKLEKAYSNVQIEPGNPNSETNATNSIRQALLDYGLTGVQGIGDTVEKYEKSRLPDKPLFGSKNLTSALTPEILESQYTLQRMDPKFKGDKYEEKKKIQRDLYGSSKTFEEDSKKKTLANVMYENTMKTADEDMARLNSVYKKAIEDGMTKLAHKYTRLGQPGSYQQITDSEELIGRLDAEFAAKRRAMLGERLQEEEGLELARMANQRNKLSSIGREEMDSANHILENTRAINDRGVERLSNLQAAEDLKTNRELERLSFDAAQGLGNRTIDMDPGIKARFQGLKNKYESRNPYGVLEPKESLRISDIGNRRVNFDENNLAVPDAHTARTTGSLNNYQQYKPYRMEDEEASKSKYRNEVSKEDARKKAIEEDIARKRANIMAEVANASEELSDDDLGVIKTLINNNRFDEAADLLEKKTKRRVSLYPRGYGKNPMGNFSKYHPNARNELNEHIADILSRKLQRATNKSPT